MRRTPQALLLTAALLSGCGRINPYDDERDDTSAERRDASVDSSSESDSREAADTGPGCVLEGEGRPEALAELGCPSDHASLAGEPGAIALPASRSVMFLVERGEGNRVHFFDTKRWRHFTYAEEKLDGYADLSVFNAEMYYLPDRRLFLGTLAHYVESDIFAMEIAPIDKASPELISEMFTLIQDSLLWPADLRYHPTSNALEMDSRLPPNAPVVTTEELYEGAVYQGLNLGRAVGRLHLVELSRLGGTTVSRMDILVLDRVPNDLSAAAGLVTSELQTPLSHVNLLSRSRGTPNMALKGAISHPDFVSSDGEWVELVVSADGYTLRPSSAAEAEELFEAMRPPETQTPSLDLSVAELVDIEDVDVTWTPAVGGKASHMGELANATPPLPLPNAFAVPVLRYMDFMAANGFDDDVSDMLDDETFRDDAAARKSALQDLRQRMAAAEVDASLISDIEAKIESDFGSARMRFRSSANVEDLEGFNGAGIYDSFGAELGDTEDTVELAVKLVWASLWNDAAFEEREWARIDHRSSAMGILINPAFDDSEEMANGVAITANPFDPPPGGQAAYYVNVQAGAVSVANPTSGVVPESFLYYKPPAGQGEMTYLSWSSLNGGAEVLSFEEIVELVGYLGDIHRYFERIYSERTAFGMDVEFKLMGAERSITIKQARPYPFE